MKQRPSAALIIYASLAPEVGPNEICQFKASQWGFGIEYTVMVLAIGNSDSEVARSVCHVYSLGFIVNLVLFSVML